MKNIKTKNGGFTLLEMLLVLAMISVLAGTLLVGMGYQRQRARATSAMKSQASVVPYAVDCYLKSKTISSPSAGTKVCSGSPIEWPDISETNCTYAAFDGANNRWRLSCDGDLYFACFVEEGNCCYTDGATYTCQ